MWPLQFVISQTWLYIKTIYFRVAKHYSSTFNYRWICISLGHGRCITWWWVSRLAWDTWSRSRVTWHSSSNWPFRLHKSIDDWKVYKVYIAKNVKLVQKIFLQNSCCTSSYLKERLVRKPSFNKDFTYTGFLFPLCSGILLFWWTIMQAESPWQHEKRLQI